MLIVVAVIAVLVAGGLAVLLSVVRRLRAAARALHDEVTRACARLTPGQQALREALDHLPERRPADR